MSATFRLRVFRYLSFILLGAGPQVLCIGQGSDLERLGEAAGAITIPFALVNNFIVVNVQVNERYALRFIVDTGAESTVLLDKQIADDLQVDYRRKFTVTGSDLERELVAYLATGIDLQLDDELMARQRSMLVLEENYANLDQVVGVPIHGILGADFLMRFVVEVDYQRGRLLLHEPSRYQAGPRYSRIQVEFHRNRAYLYLPTAFSDPQPSPRKLLLDTGASMTVLLHVFADTVTQADLPIPTVPSYIANGLGGRVNGNVGRVRNLQIGDQHLQDVVTYFQPLDTVGRYYLNDREGIIGNEVLRRFNVVIDYVRRRVYVRPDRRAARQKFKFDRSGLAVTAGGNFLRQFYIAAIVPGSPADEAGLQVGDRIAAVNRTSASFMSLGGLLARFRKRTGKLVRVKYVRDKRYYRTQFRLREII